jgi:hypothetical protein
MEPIDSAATQDLEAPLRRDSRRPERPVRLRVWLGATALALLLLAFFLAAKPTGAVTAGGGPEGFTAFIARRLQEAAPHTQFHIEGPLRLTAKTPSGDHDLYLDRIYSACLRDHDGCVETMRTFVEDVAIRYENPEPKLTRKALRVVVRDQAYFDQMKAVMADHGGPPAVSLPGDNWLIVAADLPTTIKLPPQDELKGLGLTVDQALEVGERNMAAQMRRQIRAAVDSDHSGVQMISGDPYTSSLFAFPELWTPLAASFQGKLLVAMPATDVMLFGDGAAPGMARKIANTARTVMVHDDHPLSLRVFQWSEHGWTPIAKARRKKTGDGDGE